jgi:type VI secretion system secreted protein Hcp
MPVMSSLNDYFLKIEGIEGECKQKGHVGEIQVESWSFGVTQLAQAEAGGGQGSAGRADFQDFQFSKMVDKSSPKLIEHLLTGRHLANAKATARRRGTQSDEPIDYLIIEFEDVVICSHSYTGAADQVQTEDLGFRFGKIKVHYREISETGSPGGPISGTWDLRQNMAM